LPPGAPIEAVQLPRPQSADEPAPPRGWTALAPTFDHREDRRPADYPPADLLAHPPPPPGAGPPPREKTRCLSASAAPPSHQPQENGTAICPSPGWNARLPARGCRTHRSSELTTTRRPQHRPDPPRRSSSIRPAD